MKDEFSGEDYVSFSLVRLNRVSGSSGDKPSDDKDNQLHAALALLDIASSGSPHIKDEISGEDYLSFPLFQRNRVSGSSDNKPSDDKLNQVHAALTLLDIASRGSPQW